MIEIMNLGSLSNRKKLSPQNKIRITYRKQIDIAKRPQFNLNLSLLDDNTYNPLKDRNVFRYFNNPGKKKHLRRMNLINDNESNDETKGNTKLIKRLNNVTLSHDVNLENSLESSNKLGIPLNVTERPYQRVNMKHNQ